MNGMQHLKPTFTLPASSPRQSELLWDVAFLNDAEFVEKYGVTKKHYGVD